MRDIKFRVWDKTKKKLIYVKGFVISEDHVKYFIDDTQYYKADINDIDIMQWTGLKDVNNNEIYEGDYVKIITRNDNKKFLVCWKENLASFGFEFVLVDSFAVSWHEENLPKSEEWQITGNIYNEIMYC